MTTSRAGAENRLQKVVGPHADARVHRHPQDRDRFVYFIRCLLCDKRNTTKRVHEPNGYVQARSRWVLHLAEMHPESDCAWFTKEGAVAEAVAHLQQDAVDMDQLDPLLRAAFE